MTYGSHQEAASRALVALLLNRVEDLDSSETVLACRHQAHLALHDRLWLLGANRHRGIPMRDTRPSSAMRQPARTLAMLLREMPLGEVPDLPPSAVLGLEQQAPVAEAWRLLARSLFLGNVDLQSDADRGALGAATAWYLLGDAATTIEALVVIDERLSRSGSLPQAGDALNARLLAGDVARTAVWLGEDQSPDLAAADLTEASLGSPPVWLIRTPHDFAPAQRALAGFLRPRVADETVDVYGGRPGLHTARALATGQIRLAEVFASWADSAGAPAIGERFRARVTAYQALHQSTLRLIEPSPSRSLVVDQQLSELVQGIRRLPASRLSPAQLHYLDTATHQLTVNAGATLRREGRARKNLLVVTEDGPKPITNSRNTFNRACRALADEPVSTAHEPFTRPHREQLADVLRSSPWQPAAVPLHRVR